MKGGEKMLGVAMPNSSKMVTSTVNNTNVSNSNKTDTSNDTKDFTAVFEKQKSILDEKKAKDISKGPISKEELDKEDGLELSSDKTDRIMEILSSISQLIFQIKIQAEHIADEDLDSIKVELNNLFETLSDVISYEQLELFKETKLDNIEELVAFIKDGIGEINLEVGEYVIAQLNSLIDSAKEDYSSITEEYVNFTAVEQIPEKDFSNEEIDEMDPEVVGLKEDETIERHNMDSQERIDTIDKLTANRTFESEEDAQSTDLTLDYQPVEVKVASNSMPHELQDANVDNEISREDVIQQIVDKIKLNLNEDKQEIEINLKPDVLGKLTLRMELKDGVMTAKLVVDNFRTKELIESNLLQLKEQIKDNGLEIKTFEVFVGTNQDFENQEKGKFNHMLRNNKKLRIKGGFTEGVQVYDDNLVTNSKTVYHDGQLNLFA